MRRRLHIVAAISAVLASAAAGQASADVLEIGDDGVVRVRVGVGAVVWRDGLEAPPEPIPDASELSLPAEALTIAGEAPAPLAFASTVSAVADRHGISPALLEAVVWQESRWRPGAVSPKGARGLAQLMPGTARELGVDPADPAANLDGGARYLRLQLDRFGGDVERALAAYNAGPGRVIRAGGVPNIPETRAYVAAVLGRLGAQVRLP